MTDIKHVLITGGLGYVGSRLAKDLSLLGKFNITLTSRRPSVQWPKLEMAGVEIVQLDLLDRVAVKERLKKVDTVIHLAGPDEKAVVEQPFPSIDGALKATYTLLEAAVQVQVKQFLFFSTIHVYGSPLVGYISEEIWPKPRHPYGILNRTAEDYVLWYRKMRNLNAVVFRLSNAFGSPAHKDITRWSLVVNDLCRMAIEKNEIQLYSDGSQLRDFIPLSELSKAVQYFIEMQSTNTVADIYNIGGQSSSILDIAELIKSRAEVILQRKIPLKRLELEVEPSLKKSKDKLIYSTQRLRDTGFLPNFDFQKEIDETLHFCKDNYL